jgi:AbrB family looped-hinge helix DNA binding protein
MNNETRTVGERGQVVLPKKLRERFNLRPGKKVVFEAKENVIILRPEMAPERFVEEFVAVPKKLKKISIKDVKRVIERQYEIH